MAKVTATYTTPEATDLAQFELDQAYNLRCTREGLSLTWTSTDPDPDNMFRFLLLDAVDPDAIDFDDPALVGITVS